MRYFSTICVCHGRRCGWYYVGTSGECPSEQRYGQRFQPNRGTQWRTAPVQRTDMMYPVRRPLRLSALSDILSIALSLCYNCGVEATLPDTVTRPHHATNAEWDTDTMGWKKRTSCQGITEPRLALKTVGTFLRTRSYYFFYPYYHAVCCFSGCLTYFVAAIFKERKIHRALQKAAWCFAIASGLCCMCIKRPWYQTSAPTTEFGKLCTAFFDRILWSVFLAWVTFACATGRGGFVTWFLSWRALRPLSRLALGMYLVHMPFMQFTLNISRERMFFSHFFVMSFAMVILTWGFLLTYLLYVYCEAPACRMVELLFRTRCTKSDGTAGDELPIVFGSEEKLPHISTTFPKVEKGTATKKMDIINKFDSFHRGNSSLAASGVARRHSSTTMTEYQVEGENILAEEVTLDQRYCER
ncbi:hypothetical protein HPB49_016942 [Dermacentor silvarum]|uniref:Uncharacterized protein n=1 Tax=Dermacentor silvarum TaxID=543639 RepID=A0ACB8E1P4_DERSI|nr:hypothetical protein HPB49_016942 [Dermacentor silvarum]